MEQIFEKTARAIDSVEKEKQNLIKSLSEMDKNKLSLYELKTYAEILEILSKIKIDSYLDKLSSAFCNAGFGGPPKQTIGEFKGGE